MKYNTYSTDVFKPIQHVFVVCFIVRFLCSSNMVTTYFDGHRVLCIQAQLVFSLCLKISLTHMLSVAIVK